MTPKRVAETAVRMAQMMTPNDANYHGNVFGGSILSLIDLTASAVSTKFSGRVCVTAAFDRVDFLQPVEIGDMVELDGFVSYVGRTSVEVTINVHATTLVSGSHRHVNTARVTMVAVENGRPVEVPRLICETRDEKLRFIEGKLRRELRIERAAVIKEYFSALQSMPEDELERVFQLESSISSYLSDRVKE